MSNSQFILEQIKSETDYMLNSQFILEYYYEENKAQFKKNHCSYNLIFKIPEDHVISD